MYQLKEAVRTGGRWGGGVIVSVRQYCRYADIVARPNKDEYKSKYVTESKMYSHLEMKKKLDRCQ
jgi:hypothetical protein